MALWTFDPFHELDSLRHEVERAFEQFGNTRWPYYKTAFLPGTSARTYPLLNISEDKDNIYVEALAPGMDPNSIEISVLRDTLHLAGQKAAIREDIKPEAFHRSERGAGRFARTITLPMEVDGDKVKAEYADGLLLMTLPKSEAAKPKQIAVSVN